MFGLVPAVIVILLLCRKRFAGPAFFALLTVFAGWGIGVFCMEGKSLALSKTESLAAGIFAGDRKNECVLTGIISGIKAADRGEQWVLKNCSLVWKDQGQNSRNSGEAAATDPAAANSGKTVQAEREKSVWTEQEQSFKVPGKVLCYVDGGGTSVGSRVSVYGTVSPVKPPNNPGEYDFRYACFSKGIGCQFYGNHAVVLKSGRSGLTGFLGKLKIHLESRLDRAADPEDAGIFKAVLLGERADLDQEIYDLYRRNGISHLLAISGLHMSVIGLGLYKILRKPGLGRGTAGFLAGGTLILYGMLVGFSPSVFRAVLMLLLSFLADWLGRSYDLASALGAAAFCLLVKEPFLITQAAFQLSFLAVGGIVFFGQPLIRLQVPGKRNTVFQAFLISLSVQAATLPAILYHSFEIPLYGIFLNLLVVPPMAGVLYSGLAAMAVSGIWNTAAVFCLGGGHFILMFYEWICRNVQELPGAVLCIGRPQMWQILVYYALTAAGIKMLGKERKERKDRQDRKSGNSGKERWKKYQRKSGFYILWIYAFFVLIPVKKGGLTVTFLDVGQGDGIFLEGEAWNLMVDCGSSQNKSLGEYSLVPFLKSRGITCLDMVVITHGDKDHISGIQYLLENPDSGIRIGQLLMPEAGRGEEIYEELEEAAAGIGTGISYIGRGCEIGTAAGGSRTVSGEDRTVSGGTRPMPSGGAIRPGGAAQNNTVIECLYPSEATYCRDRNDESLVLLITYGQFRLFLTGDLEESGERELLENRQLKPVTVLKAGHHGSSTSSSQLFLEALAPAETILSYGEGNRYGHPADQVVERLRDCGSGIWETAKSGAVEVWTDGNRVKIQGYRKKFKK